MERSSNIAIALILTGFGLLLSAQAQEKKIKREQLPPAVEKTVAEQSNGATIHGFSKEVHHEPNDMARSVKLPVLPSGGNFAGACIRTNHPWYRGPPSERGRPFGKGQGIKSKPRNPASGSMAGRSDTLAEGIVKQFPNKFGGAEVSISPGPRTKGSKIGFRTHFVDRGLCEGIC